jgi:dienelactone hydrolase
LRQVQPDYAAALLEAGYGVITVDSNSARGIGRFAAMSQVCTALRLWGRERAADIEAALMLAGEDARIDETRLALIGWSHGGWTVLDALDYAGEGRMPPSLAGENTPPLAGVRAAILLYPYCGFPVRADGRAFPSDIAIHAILAERDMVAPTGDCTRLFERADTAGHPVDHVIWPGITHAFDEPAAPPDPRMEYDADAAARARARIVDILDRDLRDQG